jgi:hypothetical protein
MLRNEYGNGGENMDIPPELAADCEDASAILSGLIDLDIYDRDTWGLSDLQNLRDDLDYCQDVLARLWKSYTDFVKRYLEQMEKEAAQNGTRK